MDQGTKLENIYVFGLSSLYLFFEINDILQLPLVESPYANFLTSSHLIPLTKRRFFIMSRILITAAIRWVRLALYTPKMKLVGSSGAVNYGEHVNIHQTKFLSNMVSSVIWAKMHNEYQFQT